MSVSYLRLRYLKTDNDSNAHHCIEMYFAISQFSKLIGMHILVRYN